MGRPPSAEDFAELEVEQEHQALPNSGNVEAGRSPFEELEWHLIDQSECGSRPRSENDHVEVDQEASHAAAEEPDSDGVPESISSTGENEQVANSFLQMSFMAERQQQQAAEPAPQPPAEEHFESEAGLVRRMSGLSSEGGLEGFAEQAPQLEAADADAAAGEQPAAAPTALVASVKGSVVDLVTFLYEHVAHMLRAVQGSVMGQYESISQVVVDSVQMAYETARAANRAVHEAVPSAVEAAVAQLRSAHPKRLSSSQWAALALGVSQLATAAVLVATLVRSHRLQRALASKDRELGGLLMRIFSLQELLQQGGARAVPLIRHASHVFVAP